MSQQPDNPQTPKPNTSSPSLLTAFRNLTGQKKSPSSLSSTSTPAAENSAVKSFSESSSTGSTQHLKRIKPASRLSDVHGKTIDSSVDDDIPVGGPPQLDYLMGLLSPGHALKERIHAASSISSLLAEYPVGNVGVVWSRAKDLLEIEKSQPAFDAGYNLMLACIKHASLDLVERPLFLESTVSQSLLAQPSLCLQALSTLTNRGKSLEGLDSGQLASLLVRLLGTSYKCAAEARSKANPRRTEPASTEESTLAGVFQYFVDAVKFSSKVFMEAQVDLIIQQILIVCKQTAARSDLEHSLDILDTILTYSNFPKCSLRPCVEVLCGIFCSVEILKPRSKSTFSKLLSSYLGPDVLHTLQDILRESHSKPVQDRNAVRGAVQLLQEAIRENLMDSATKITLADLLHTLHESLIIYSASLELDILNMLCCIVNVPDMVESLFSEPEWMAFSRIMTHCANGKAVADAHSSAPPSKAPAEQPQRPNKQSSWYSQFTSAFKRLASRLISMSREVDADRKLSIMSLLLKVSFRMDDPEAQIILEFYAEERLLQPSQNSWLENCHLIQKTLFQDNSRSLLVRQLSLELLCNAYNCAEALNVAQASELVYSLIDAISLTKDLQLLEYLAEFSVGVAQWAKDEHTFTRLLDVMQKVLFSSQLKFETTSDASPLEGSSDARLPPATPTSIIARSLVKIFLRCLNSSPEKTERLFQLLLSVARSPEPLADARVIAMKLLARLRSDVSHAIFVSADTESESIAVALCRTAASASVIDSLETIPKRVIKEDETASKRQNQIVRGSAAQPLASQPSAATTPAVRTVSNPTRATRPTPPLWMYPGPKGLPEDPPAFSSHVVYSHINAVDQHTTHDDKAASGRTVLKMGLWLELVLDLLQRKELEWETYSYLIVHLGAQLMNHALFADATPQIKHLRNVLCDLLQNKTFHEPPSSTKLKKSDVAICLYDILTKLVSYRQHFAKSEEDEMVKTFVLGIGSWERTSEICIHALSVCCHEMPMSIVKCLDAALQKMIQIITQSTNAVHVLEFLSGLARLPSLFRNFREDEFKAVFGICFRYLQYVRDQRNKTPWTPPSKSHASTRPSRDGPPSSEARNTGGSLAEVLPQYVYALAYHVMTFWFMALKLQDRPRQMAWIRRNLIFTNDKGEDVMEEQSQVTIDLMHRVAFSDRDETLPNASFALEVDGVVSTKSYLVGLSILTVATAGRTGVSHITIRRPSGNKYSVSRPQITDPPRHQVGINAGAFYSSDYVGVTPDDVVQSLYSPLSISPSLASLTEGPIPLPDDDATKRSIASFDRISALDGHKVGIIYVGDGQTAEVDILANSMGSADYITFLGGLGTLTELNGATFNTQGLDREYGTDGKFTYCWRDRVSELVFHVTTMMPTNLERDPQCSLKKRHIGNDFVNIVFNNSGLPFKFDTFPSAFNYVNIVISPEARSSFIETRLHAARRQKKRQEERRELESLEKDETFVRQDDRRDSQFYKVTVMTKPGLPKTSPASETQIVSGKSLAAFVRLLALNASVFAQVWANKADDEHVSSWRSRLREIIRLRERHVAFGDDQAANNPSSSGPSAHTPSSSSDKWGRESGILKRTSATTYFSDGGTTRSSGIDGVAEIERTNSPSSYD